MNYDPFQSFTALNKSADITFNKEYAPHEAAALTKINDFHLAAGTLYGDAKIAYDTLAVEAQQAKDAYKVLTSVKDTDAKVLQEAKNLAATTEKNFLGFLRGEYEYVLPKEGAEAVKIKLSKDYAPAVMDAFKEAEQAAAKVVRPAHSFAGGIVRTQEHGWSKALKHNGEQMKFWKEGLSGAERGIAFGRVAGVGASGVAIADGLLRSQTRDGENRSGLVRTGEVAAGTAGLLASLVGGSAKSLARL